MQTITSELHVHLENTSQYFIDAIQFFIELIAHQHTNYIIFRN